MSRLLGCTLGIAFCAGILTGETNYAWYDGKVVDKQTRHENSDSGPNSAGGPTQPRTVTIFDIDDGKAIYVVKEVTLARHALALEIGSDVRFAIDGKKMLIQIPDQKPRKLELTGTFPRPDRKPAPK